MKKSPGFTTGGFFVQLTKNERYDKFKLSISNRQLKEARFMDVKLGMVEARFADIIWENEPLSTKDLVAICNRELDWKRTTTYTVLKKLCDRGIFQTKDSVITSLISKQEFHAMQSEAFVKENFQGSLPAFLAAFTTRKALTQAEIEELQKLINSFKG